MSYDLPIQITPITEIPEAHNYVKDSWAKSFRSAAKHLLPNHDFAYKMIDPVLKEILFRATHGKGKIYSIDVAILPVDSDTYLGCDSDTYLGWMCHVNGYLAYCYTGLDFRGHSVARRLLLNRFKLRPPALIMTDAGRALLDHVYNNIINGVARAN